MKYLYLVKIFQSSAAKLHCIVAESDEECVWILIRNYLPYEPYETESLNTARILLNSSYLPLIKESKRFALADDEVESGVVTNDRLCSYKENEI